MQLVACKEHTQLWEAAAYLIREEILTVASALVSQDQTQP